MTKEEAIKYFRNAKGLSLAFDQAADIAIKALEQETVSKETYDHEFNLRKEFEMKVFELERKIAEQEPSEDCISREWVLKKFQKGKEKIYKSEYFDELIWLVKHAPSVVPKGRREE